MKLFRPAPIPFEFATSAYQGICRYCSPSGFVCQLHLQRNIFEMVNGEKRDFAIKIRDVTSVLKL